MALKILRYQTFVTAIYLALVSIASAATDSSTAEVSRFTRVPRPTPNAAAMVREAATERVFPTVVPADLPKMTSKEIVERNVAVRGGLQAWQRVGSMSLTGKLDAGKTRTDGGQAAVVSKKERAKARAELRKALQEGKPVLEAQKVIQLPFQMDLRRPTMTRLEIPFQGETAVQVYDGANGWKLRPYLGRHEVEPFSEEELKLAAGQQELDGPLINLQAKGTSVEVEGGELIEGRGAYRLKLTLKNGDVRHLWVDAQNFLDVKIEAAPRRWDGKWHTVTTSLRDYKQVDGLMIAHRLETRVEGVPGSESIYIETVALNPSLDGNRFTRPQ